jgi:hypothetical protein
MIHTSKHVSVSINRSVEDVYAFASSPQNLTEWAHGLSQSSLTQSGDEWIADSPMGKVRIRFAGKNSLGVLDHDVTLPDGEVNHNPFRIIKNGDGSEAVFTVYRRAHMSDADFEKDAGTVKKDLEKLKAILEKSRQTGAQ